MAQKRVSLTVEKMLEVLEYAEENLKASQGDIARHLSISQPTVSTILRKKDSILALASKGLAIAEELQRAGLADAKNVPASDAG